MSFQAFSVGFDTLKYPLLPVFSRKTRYKIRYSRLPREIARGLRCPIWHCPYSCPAIPKISFRLSPANESKPRLWPPS